MGISNIFNSFAYLYSFLWLRSALLAFPPRATRGRAFSCNLPRAMKTRSANAHASENAHAHGSGASNQDESRVYTYQEIIAHKGTQGWRHNNSALKWLRDSNESPRGTPTVVGVDLTPHDTIRFARLERTTGTAYAFSSTDTVSWSWKAMLAEFPTATLLELLGTDNTRGGGITSIRCEPLAGSYDHKRHHAAVQESNPFPACAPVPIWDFVVYNVAGHGFRFHPNQTNRKVSLSHVSTTPLADVPASGRGGTSGAGTFRACVQASYSRQTHFVMTPQERENLMARGVLKAAPPQTQIAPPTPLELAAYAPVKAPPPMPRRHPPTPSTFYGQIHPSTAVAVATPPATAIAAPQPPPQLLDGLD